MNSVVQIFIRQFSSLNFLFQNQEEREAEKEQKKKGTIFLRSHFLKNPISELRTERKFSASQKHVSLI